MKIDRMKRNFNELFSMMQPAAQKRVKARSQRTFD
jgi:hypothetical protein